MRRAFPATLVTLLGLALLALTGAAPAWADEAPATGAPVVVPAPPPPAPALVVAGCGTCAPACPTCQACLPACRRLTIEGHASLLMPGPEGAPGGVPSGLPNAIDWDSLDYDVAFGGRLAYEWRALRSWTARVSGTFWGSWSDTATVNGTLGARTAAGAAVTPSATMDVPLDSEATLFDVELSLWRPCVSTSCWCAAWGFGLRYVNFHEESTFSFPQATPPVVGGPPGVATTATTAAEATNLLLAAQVLGRLGLCLTRDVDLTVDVAGFLGWRHTKSEVTPSGFVGAAVVTGGTVEEDALGFGFAADVALRWKVCPSWSLRAGYGVIALFDQARAYELADFSHTGNGNLGPKVSEDTVIAHRVFLGVEFDF